MAIYSKKEEEALKWDEQHLYGSNRMGMWRYDTIVPEGPPVVGEATSIYDSLLLGSRAYELSNHLGNVLSTISDKKIGNDSSSQVNYYIAEVLSQSDYYPFGMMMPGRKYIAGNYRYGFNGKENDNEVKGEGNQQDYGMRIYDPRLGRFLSVDPLEEEYPELTPYQFASNRPIDGVDLDGLEWSKSDPYFLSPVGKYVVDYKVVLSIPEKSNWNVSNESSYLNEMGRQASNILSNPNASGTMNDPIVNVSISFKDDNKGTFKFSAVTATIYINQNTGDIKPTTQTRLSDGTLFNEKIQATGMTKTIGDVVNNEVKLITFTGLMFSTNGKNDLPKSISVMDKVMTLKDWARTLAHELGHTLGLHHPWDKEDVGADKNDIRNEQGLGPVFKPNLVLKNLMNSTGNEIEPLKSGTGKELTPEQRKKVSQKLDEVKEP